MFRWIVISSACAIANISKTCDTEIWLAGGDINTIMITVTIIIINTLFIIFILLNSYQLHSYNGLQKTVCAYILKVQILTVKKRFTLCTSYFNYQL